MRNCQRQCEIASKCTKTARQILADIAKQITTPVLETYFEGVVIRDVEAEAEAGSGSGGSGLFLWKRKRKREKFHRFRFHIGGRMEREKKLVLLSFVEERIGEHKH